WGNKRTPEKFVGKEAVITSQCLNGWYLVKALDSGESTRLQYRSLKKVPELQLQTQARLQPLAFLGGRQ
uniref:PUB 62/63 C-terminal domain-containing protein n=1 Tax=Aegilops tauschii subsp. strangulata TaxID=200361 RepID=A0A453Q7L3_AEGTS